MTRAQSAQVERQLGLTACLPHLPEDIKDANEWLVSKHPSEQLVAGMLNRSATLIDYEVWRISQLTGLTHQDAIEEVIEPAAAWDKTHINRLRTLMKDCLKISTGFFNDLLKTYQEMSETQEESGADGAQILGDDVLLISPMLGFTPEIAVITVSIMERTSDNRLTCNPIW